MIETADVLVVGLGPAGACAAAEVARRGRKVIAIDRKREAGRPVQCAELVPAMIGMPEVASTARQRIESMATFVEDDAPDFRGDFPGHMVDRAAFDAALVARAAEAGVDVRFSCAVQRVHKSGIVELADGRRLCGSTLIGADGPRSRVGRAIGSVNKDLVETRQVTVRLRAPRASTDIFLASGIPGGYGWLFPKGEVANLGAGVAPAHKFRLREIIAELHARLVREGKVGEAILGLTGGLIPVGGMLRALGTLGDTRVLLAGDAAGLANPVTGAGICAAVQSGGLAGEAAATGAHAEYQDDLEDLLGASLDRALRRRREILASIPTKAALRRGWIAYPEYWQ
jgi:digeranylgeranylglycerophospholipid reductase